MIDSSAFIDPNLRENYLWDFPEGGKEDIYQLEGSLIQ